MSQPPSKPDIDTFRAPFFFFSCNLKSRILYVSPSVHEVLGYTPDDLTGREFANFLDRDSPLNGDFELCNAKHRNGDENDRLRVVIGSDEQFRVLRMQVCQIRDRAGTVTECHFLAQDVTGMYFAEQELHQRLVQLRGIESALSAREKNVLLRVMDGEINKTIAKELSVSQRAVEQIRARLLKKFAADTTAELVSKATELRMLTHVIRLVDRGEATDQSDSQRLFMKRSQN